MSKADKTVTGARGIFTEEYDRLLRTEYDLLTDSEYDRLLQAQYDMIDAGTKDMMLEARAQVVVGNQSPQIQESGSFYRETRDYGKGYQRTLDLLTAYRDRLRSERDDDGLEWDSTHSQVRRSSASGVLAMSNADKVVADAMAALDQMTVDDLERVDTDTLRRLEALAHHWSEIAATAIQRRVEDAPLGTDGFDQ